MSIDNFLQIANSKFWDDISKRGKKYKMFWCYFLVPNQNWFPSSRNIFKHLRKMVVMFHTVVDEYIGVETLLMGFVQNRSIDVDLVF